MPGGKTSDDVGTNAIFKDKFQFLLPVLEARGENFLFKNVDQIFLRLHFTFVNKKDLQFDECALVLKIQFFVSRIAGFSFTCI